VQQPLWLLATTVIRSRGGDERRDRRDADQVTDGPDELVVVIGHKALTAATTTAAKPQPKDVNGGWSDEKWITQGFTGRW
jgi:hypothetical protein